MREQPVLIVGGGLIGLASAYALAARGVAVRVIERHGLVGDGTSHANGGLVTPGMPEPWNGPGVARELAASMLDAAAPMKLRAAALPALMGWGLRFLRHCGAAHCRYATAANYRLAQASVQALRAWRERLALAYDGRASGSLCIGRHGAPIDAQRAVARQLGALGLRYRELDAGGATELEPALRAIASSITGALHFPDDEVGDGRALCAALARAVTEAGGAVDTSRCVRRIVVRSRRVVALDTDGGEMRAGRVVVAAGPLSAALLRPAGVRLPIAPAKGYSLTVEPRSRDGLPSLPVNDCLRHVVLTPLGSRLRIAGTAEFAGNDLRLRPERIAPLAAALREIYPQLALAADPAAGSAWTGLRPVSADGLPFIGPTGIEGLYVNGGHGALGLTLAAGSGLLLADLMCDTPAAVDPAPYSPLR